MNPIKWWFNILDNYTPGMMIVMGIILLFSITTLPILESEVWRYYAHFLMGLICLFFGTLFNEGSKNETRIN